jgi:hypothetical protein
MVGQGLQVDQHLGELLGGNGLPSSARYRVGLVFDCRTGVLAIFGYVAIRVEQTPADQSVKRMVVMAAFQLSPDCVEPGCLAG